MTLTRMKEEVSMARKLTAELPLKIKSKLNVVRACLVAADLPAVYILDLIGEMAEERGNPDVRKILEEACEKILRF